MKYLGIDWGLNRIGLAISEGRLASPLGTLNVQASGFDKAVAKLMTIISEEEAQQIVLGNPEGKMGGIVEKVAITLRKRGLSVVLADETLSTQDAKRLMVELNIGKKARKEDNAVAAAIILQRYLDEET